MELKKEVSINFDSKRNEYSDGLMPSETLVPFETLVPKAGVLVGGGVNISIRFLEEGEILK